jgi:transposase-like protein
MSKNQHKPAKQKGRKWAAPVKNPYTPTAKQAAVMALGIAGKSKVQIAREVGLNRETVTRILSQSEYTNIIEGLRSKIASNLTPAVYKSLEKLIKKAHAPTVMQTLFGLKVLSQRHEREVSETVPQRDYADTKVKFYYNFGRWPTKEECLGYDKTLPIEPLFKGELE